MIKVHMSAARALAFATVLMMNTVPVPAVTPQSAATQPDILVLINAPSQSGEDFTPMIAEAAAYKLGNLGLASQIVSATPSEADAPLQRARASGASAALVCRYQLDGGQMVVTLGWFDAQSNTSVAVQTRGAVDLHLDEVILAAFDDILGKVQTRINALSARRAGTPSPLTAPAGLTLPPVGGAVQVVGSHTPVSPAPHRFLLSSGFAPFVPTGAASYYFSLGYLPSFLASFFLDTPAGPLGVGLYAGVDYFAATGTAATSTNYLIPLGLDLRYEMGSGSFRPYFHLVGGPAFLVMNTSSEGRLTDILPFLKSGLGVELDISSQVGISALVDYDVYFEMPYLLTGFAPSLNMVYHP